MATVDLERDVVEMSDMPFGLGMDLGSLSTAVGGEDGEPVPEGEGRRSNRRISPAPAYNSLEMGFRPGGLRSPTPSLDEHSANHARGDIERGSTDF